MDHERYPYYFDNTPPAGIRAEHLEHARDSFLAVASGLLAAVRRLGSLLPIGER
ncbi:MAG TPA: hypothetical protein VFE23_04580 [Usitatibacter sp.]|jgi:hypothetical protein|nr:hypothetical protein [Usitatibacter sp.]